MTTGKCDNSIGLAWLGLAWLGLGHCVLHPACQVVSHNRFKSIKKFITEDGVHFALPSVFLYALKGGDALW